MTDQMPPCGMGNDFFGLSFSNSSVILKNLFAAKCFIDYLTPRANICSSSGLLVSIFGLQIITGALSGTSIASLGAVGAVSCLKSDFQALKQIAVHLHVFRSSLSQTKGRGGV